MGTRVLFAAIFTILVACLAGVWMSSTSAIAAPVESLVDQTPQAISGGTEDMRDFFNKMGFKETFRVMASLRDEALGRRYYRVKIDPSLNAQLRTTLASKWIEGRMNRSVYENGLMARVKKSRNLPKWWNVTPPPAADHLMLDHGGQPVWYVVLSNSGEACFMWVKH